MFKDKVSRSTSALSSTFRCGKTTFEVFKDSRRVWMTFAVNPETFNVQSINVSRESAAEFIRRMRRFSK